MAKRLEELQVYLKAKEFWAAVNEILQRPQVRRNRKLHEQIDDANDSITANIEEGFEESTDASFASYLCHAKGSTAEVAARLRQCCAKGYITEDELKARVSAAEELGRMMGAFIRYLTRCDYRDRGRFKAAQQRDENPPRRAPQRRR